MSNLKKPPSRWEYGGYYLDNPHPERGGGWYACRYDPQKRVVSRRSLKTADFEEAQARLVALTEADLIPQGQTPGPERLLILVAMNNYDLCHGSMVRSKETSKRVVELMRRYLDAKGISDAKVASFTPSRQIDFCKWLHAEYKHSPATIIRYIKIVGAAFNFAAKVVIRADGMGKEVEGALITHAPKVLKKEADVRKFLALPAKKTAIFVPTLDEMATFIDALKHDHLKRWVLLAMSTWARPEAVTDFDPHVQWDRRVNMIDLDPPGRPLTSKRRSRIPCCRTLAASLEGWMQPVGQMERPPILMHNGERITSVKARVRAAARGAGFDRLTQKTVRTFMATMVRKLAPGVQREKRSIWLGHIVAEGSNTTDHYEIMDAEYLAPVALATDHVIQRVRARVKDKSFAVEVLLSPQALSQIGVDLARDFASENSALAESEENEEKPLTLP